MSTERKFNLFAHLYFVTDNAYADELIGEIIIGKFEHFQNMIETFNHTVCSWPQEIKIKGKTWTFGQQISQGLEGLSYTDTKWQKVLKVIEAADELSFELREAQYINPSSTDELQLVLYIKKE